MAGRTDLEQLVYQMSSDIRQLTAANKRALSDVKETTSKAQREYDRLADEMGRGFKRTSLAAGVAFGAIVAVATKAASEANETANAFGVAFGKLTPQATKFAQTYSNSVGRALDETQANMAKTQLILTGIGISADKALGMTEKIQKRAVDLGSLWNVDDAQAYQAMISGINGEAEPMRKFGVAVNEAAVKVELMRLGFKGNAEQAPEAAKAIARLNIIMRSTTSADGDAVKTKDQLANSVKAAQAEFRNAAVQLGNNFLPAATAAAHAASDLLTEFNKLPDGVKMAGLAALGMVAAGGPIANLIEAWGKVVKMANAAKAAQIAAAGASGAAAGGGIAGVLGGAAMTGGLIASGAAYAALGVKGAFDAVDGGKRYTMVQNLLKKPELVRGLKDDDIAALQTRLRTDAKRQGEEPQSMYGDFGVPTSMAKKALGYLAGEVNARKAIADKAKPKVDDPFTLTDDLKKPVADPNKASQTAKEQADRTNAALKAARDRELSAQEAATQSIEERAKIQLQRIDDDKKARDKDLELAIAKKELTAPQVREIKAAEAKARTAERARITAEKDEALKQASFRLNQQLAGYEQDALASQEEITKGVFARNEIERHLLALRQDEERKALEEDIRRNPDLKPGDAAKLRAGLAKSQAGAREVLAKTQQEDLKSSILAAFEAAKGGAGSLAKYFGDRLEEALLGALADKFAKSILSGDGAGLLGSVGRFAKSFAGMFADGGTIPTGQWGIFNEAGAEPIRAKPGGGIEVMSNRSFRALSGVTQPVASRVIVQDRVVQIVTQASPYFDSRVQSVAAPGALSVGQAAAEAGAAKAAGMARVNQRYKIAR